MSFNATINDIAEIVMGQSPKGEECNNKGLGLPLLNGPTEFTSRSPIPVQFTEAGNKFAEPDDILFCVRGSTTGKMNYADQRYVIGRGIASIRGKNGYPTPYVRAVLEQNLDRLLVSATGSTFPNVGRDLLNNFEINSVSPEDACKINKLIISLECKIALNHQINQTLESMAQAIFKSWFVDFEPVKAKIAALESGEDAEGVTCAAMRAISGKTDDELDKIEGGQPEDYAQLKATAGLFPAAMQDSVGEVPEGWKVSTIDSVAKKIAMGPFGSNIKVSTFVEQGVPIISGQHLHETLLTESTYNYITEEHAKKLANSCVSSGDIIFTHAGNIGQVSLIPSITKYAKYVISQRQFYLRPDSEQITSFYLVYFFRSHNGQHLLLANASQVGVPSISRPSSYLKSIEIVVPAKPVLQQFENNVECLIKQIGNIRCEIEYLTKIRVTLLPKLLSGELSVDAFELAGGN